MFNFFKTFIQPVAKAVQSIVRTVQTWIQPAAGNTGTPQQSVSAPTPVTTITPEEREHLRRQRAEAARQRKLARMEGEFERSIAQTSHKDLRPISLLDLSEEIDNPMYRAIKQAEKEGILDPMLKASPSPDKVFNAIVAEWGRDEELDARALAMWVRYHQSSTSQATRISQPKVSAIPLEIVDTQQLQLPQWLQDVTSIVRTPGALGAIGQGIILNTVYGVDITHSNGGNWLEWFRQDEHAAERIQEAFSAVTDITTAIAREAYQANGGPETIGSQIVEWIRDPLNSQEFFEIFSTAQGVRNSNELKAIQLFRQAFGNTAIQLTPGQNENDPSAYASTSVIDNRAVIYLYSNPSPLLREDIEQRGYTLHTRQNIVHEFGHALVFLSGEGESGIYKEWENIEQRISDFDTTMGWSGDVFKNLLQNQSTMKDINKNFTAFDLENERLANMFQASVYNYRPLLDSPDERQRRAAWAMYTFMTGICPPEDVAIDGRSGIQQPCGQGIYHWIQELGNKR